MTVQSHVLTLLSRWEELRAEGKSITPEELCADCPELLDEVRKRIEHLEWLGSAITQDKPAGTLDASVPRIRPPASTFPVTKSWVS